MPAPAVASTSPDLVLPHPTQPDTGPASLSSRQLLARLTRALGPIETGFGLLVTLASVYLHMVQARVAGGLWRDEVVSVQVANLPTLAGTWRYLEFDSYPILFHLLLRGWCALFGAGDVSLRVLGAAVGCSVLGALWAAGRTLGVRAPIFALVLLALNPMVIRFGDSMRAYGLGCALALVSLAAVWNVARSERPGWRRVLWAMAAAVLSVQCLYHNAALLLAACLGGAVVAMWNRRPAVAAVTVAVGVPAAASLLPYLPIIARTRHWSILMKFPVTVSWLWSRLTAVTGAPDPVGVWLWSALFVGALGVAGAARWRDRAAGADRRVFAAVALVAGTALYGGFLFAVGYITQPWYYLALLAFAGVCLDAVYGQRDDAPGWRALRLAVALSFALIVFEQSHARLRVRSTNIDLLAARLNGEATGRDLIVVNRWECGIGMNRYYHGPARMMTVPPLDDHLVHRYDVVMAMMAQPDPLRPLFDAMTETLQRGGRVWLVGPRNLPEPGQPFQVPPPAWTDAAGRWHPGPSYADWALQTNEFLVRHVTLGALVGIPSREIVSEYENVPLGWFSGWQEGDDPAAANEKVKPAVP